MKQRLVGAAVLVALAVIFLPMLVQGPAPDSGVSDVPLSMPDAPTGNYETQDLPLVTPGVAAPGGAVGMPAAGTPAASQPVADAPAAAVDSASMPAQSDATTPASASTAVAMGDAADASSAPLPTDDALLPATTAAGDYAVHFGSYASSDAADRVLAPLRAAQLPVYKQQGLVNGKPVWRVRIGPYATRAAAETARLRATGVRADVDARVVTLDAVSNTTAPMPTLPPPKPAASTASATTPAAAPKPTAVTPPPSPAPAAAASGTGFAVQLAAYTKASDALALRDKLRAAGFTAFTESVTTDKGTLTRVRVGPVASRSEADALKTQVKVKVGVDGIVRPHP